MTRNFTLASQVEILLRTAICQADGCTTPLSEGVEWDHTIPWAISKDRSAKNGQALCPSCHATKTNEVSHGGKSDKTNAAKCRRVYRKHTGDLKPKGNIQAHVDPWPKGRGFNTGIEGKSKWTPNVKDINEPDTGDENVSE